MSLDYGTVSSQSGILNNGIREGGNHGIPIQRGTASSDSDSGNSLFITQAVTSSPPRRHVRRRRSQASSQSIPSLLLEDTSDSESEESGLFFAHRSETDSRGSRRKKPKSIQARVKRGKICLPFLKAYCGKANLSLKQQQVFVNSSIGGFFQCMNSLSRAEESQTADSLSEELLSLSDLEEEAEEHGDNQEDIKVVDGALFIQRFRDKNRDVWGCKNKNSPAAARKSKTKPQENRNASKGLNAGQTRKSKQSTHAGVKKKATGPNTETASKRPPRLRPRQCSAKGKKSSQSLASHESSAGTEGGKKRRGKENSCSSTQVPPTSQTDQGRRVSQRIASQRIASQRGASQRPGVSASGGKDTDVIAGQTSDDETDIEENNLQTRSLSVGGAGQDGSRHVSGAVESSTELSRGSATVNERATDVESSILPQVCSGTNSCSRDNHGTLSELHSPVVQTETEILPDSTVNCENVPTQVHADASFEQTDEVGGDISYCEKPQGEAILSDAIVTVGGVQCDMGASQTSDDESQSLLDPWASRVQKTKDNMVFCERFQLLGGDTSFPVPHHGTEINRKKDDAKQSKADRELPASLSKDSMLVNPPDAGKEDLQNKVRAALTTENSLEIQEHHALPQKKKSAINREKSDTGDTVLEGNNDNVASQSCEQLEQNETELTLIQPTTKKKKKHKKDKKRDSLSVNGGGTHEDGDGILQNTLLSPVPETEGETSSQKKTKKKKKQKHNNKQNSVELEPEDVIQQQSEEQINLYRSDGQSEQPTDSKKKKKKKKKERASGALELEQNFSEAQMPSPVVSMEDNEVLLSQVCMVSSDTLNSPAKKKKKKKKKEQKGGIEALTSAEDVSSFSQKTQVTTSQEMGDEKKTKRKQNKKKVTPGENNPLEGAPNQDSDASKQLQVNETDARQDPVQCSGLSQAPVPPELSGGPGVGRKRKKNDTIAQGSICSATFTDAEAPHPKKKKKKRRRSESHCSSGAVKESDERLAQGQLEIAEKQTTLPISHSTIMDQACVGSTPGDHSGELKEGPKSKEKRKKKRDLSLVSVAADVSSRTDIDTHQAETVVPNEQVCLSPEGHKKKKKKKKSRGEMSSEVTLGDTNVTASFTSEKGSVTSAGLPSVELDSRFLDATRVRAGSEECPALFMSERDEKRKKKKKSKHKHSDVQEDGVLPSSPIPPNLMSDPEDVPQPKKKKKKKKDSLL